MAKILKKLPQFFCLKCGGEITLKERREANGMCWCCNRNVADKRNASFIGAD